MTAAQTIVESLLDDELDPKEFAIDTRTQRDAADQDAWNKGDITPAVARMLGYGDTLYHRTVKNSTGEPASAKVQGTPKFWATRPNEFQVTVKYGLKTYVKITPYNAGEWTTQPPPSQQTLNAQRDAKREMKRQGVYNRDEPALGESRK